MVKHSIGRLHEGVSNDSEDVYLKVDEICSKYGKEIKDFFTKGAKNREIIQELISNRHGINDFSKRRNLLLTELPYMSPNWDGLLPKSSKANKHVDGIRYNKVELDYLVYRLSGRAKNMKAEVKGTYIHKDLLIPFLMWVDGKVAVRLIKAIDEIIKDYYSLKKERIESTMMFYKLTKVTAKAIGTSKDTNFRKFDSLLMDMINIEVIGMRAMEYKKKHGISPNALTREWLSETQLHRINWCQDEVCAYIKYMKMDNYQEIKVKLHEEYVEEFSK